MNNNRVKYQDYLIVAHPFQLKEREEWTLDIEIEHHFGSGVKCCSFSAGNTFKTKEEAMKHCFLFGKKIIDGEIKDLSI